MKSSLLLGLVYAATAWTAPIEDPDDQCEMEWVPAANATASGTGSASLAAASANPSAPSGSTGSSGPGTQGATSANSANIPGFPADGQHLSAPVSDAAVPADARTYTPPGKTISGKALEAWMGDQAKSNAPASKWLKIAPGLYDVDCSDGIVFSFMDGLTQGWTMDMRQVTFMVAGSCQAIYINQCEDFTILGGTLWFDAGEIWTQGKVTSVQDIGGGSATVTCTVDENYNLTTWRSAGPRNLAAMDASNPNHFTRLSPNFWFASDWNFDNLDSQRTWTMKVGTDQVPLKVGNYLMMETGITMGNTIGSENNGNLHINGFTSNGGLSQYGLGSKGTATFENVWYVNAPARPGFAQRVEGPTMSEGHIQWFDYDTPGQPKINYVNSWWMTTGCEKDLQSAADQDLHDGGY